MLRICMYGDQNLWNSCPRCLGRSCRRCKWVTSWESPPVFTAELPSAGGLWRPVASSSTCARSNQTIERLCPVGHPDDQIVGAMPIKVCARPNVSDQVD